MPLITAFRLTCVIMVAIVALPPVANAVAGLPAALAGSPRAGDLNLILAAGLTLALAFTSLFAWSTWVVTRPREHPGRLWVHLLIGVQLVLSYLLVLDLVHLITAQVAVTLPGRQAWRWLMALMALVCFVALMSWIDGSFVPIDHVDHLPLPVQVFVSVLTVCGWNGVAFAAGRLVVAERGHSRELLHLNAALQSTRDLLAQTARMSERIRIARELHDTLGHHLTALAVNLELAARLPPAEAAPIVERSQLISRLLLNDVRETVAHMRDDRSLDITASLQALAAGVPSPPVHLELSGAASIDDPESAHTLVRCAQEGLTNAMRHAGARNIWLTLSADNGRTVLEVRDDGQGAASIQPGNGLQGMRERVEALGGTLTWSSQAGDGFHLSLSLPQAKERP